MNKSGIDNNTRNVGLGYVHGTNNITMPFSIDSASNRLLIEVIPIGVPLDNLAATHMKEDANGRNTAGGVSDLDGQTIIPLTTDSIAGFPCVRVEIN